MKGLWTVFLVVVLISAFFSLIFLSGFNEVLGLGEEVEIREYKGEYLSSIDDFRENSILGPQYVDMQNYSLVVEGLVENELEFSYDEVLDGFESVQKVVTLLCVDGWSVTLLWEGVRLEDLFDLANVNSEASVVIFHAYDGYSTSLPLEYILDNRIIIAYKMNNVTLPPERGFPFELVAESKFGYKWIKWITKIELSNDEEFRGYWELRGYSNYAETSESYPTPPIDFFTPLPKFTPSPTITPSLSPSVDPTNIPTPTQEPTSTPSPTPVKGEGSLPLEYVVLGIGVLSGVIALLVFVMRRK